MDKISNKYFIGVFWFLCSIIIGVANDIVTKKLGKNINSFEIVFFRFFFGTIALIPFIIKVGKKSLYSSNKIIHVIRGTLLFGGIWIWTHSLNNIHVATATVINFTIPIFVLILAKIILNEKVGSARAVATLIGFVGVFIVAFKPEAIDITAVVLLLASFMFALLDVVNKKYVVKESMIAMIFYSNIITMLCSVPFIINEFVTPSNEDFLLLIVLGVGANLLLYCLLKAFSMADASALVPFRYFEILFSGYFGYLFFGEIPGFNTLLGSLLIIPSTLFISYIASRRKG